MDERELVLVGGPFQRARELLAARAEWVASPSIPNLALRAETEQGLEQPQDLVRPPQLDASVLTLQQATSVASDDITLWSRLANSAALRGRWREALKAYAMAAKLSSDDPAFLTGVALAQLCLQQVEAALSTAQEILERFPRHALSYLAYAQVCRALGRSDDARQAYERALQLAPDDSRALFNLTDIHPPRLGSRRARRIAKLASRTDLTEEGRANLEFSLARIHECARQFKRAFGHYREANLAQQRSLRARGVIYDPTESEGQFEALVGRHTAVSFQRPIESLRIALRPIFIVGMPRSGTTLVEQILASHPQVCGGGELIGAQLCYALYLRKRGERRLAWPANPCIEAESELLMEMRERYLEHLFELDLDNDYVTDKLPGNITALGFIRMMFPDAPIVHCVRNPVATCWSIYSSNLGAHAPYYTSLDHLAHYYRLYRSLMKHWEAVLQPGVIEVRYETLVTEPETDARRLVAACGLSWDDRCLEFHRNPRPIVTASVDQVRKPMYASSIEHWKHYEPYIETLLGLRGHH